MKKKKYLKPGVRGAVSELLVCADLLKREYEVFRSVSPHCDCDLIAHKKGKFLRVEVKTGMSFIDEWSGKIVLPVHDKKKCDLLAVVSRKGKIEYHPKIA